MLAVQAWPLDDNILSFKSKRKGSMVVFVRVI